MNIYTRERFIQRYIGFDVEFADENEKYTLSQDERVIDMPDYPYNGSIQRIDNYIVVKLG